MHLERTFHKGLAFQAFYTIGNAFVSGVTDSGMGNNYVGVVPEASDFVPGAVPAGYDERNRFLNYQRDGNVPKHSFRWKWIAELPFGRGKKFAGHLPGWANKLAGGWQMAGMGSLRSNYFSLPTNVYPTGAKIETYGYRYPIEDCRSGACYPGYLWWNGYIPSNQVNARDAAGRCVGVCGVPSDWKPAGAPLIPWGSTALPANAPAGTVLSTFWNTNTVWVPLKNGTAVRTVYAPGAHPWMNQYLPGVRQWNMDASLFKSIPLTERLRLRINIDFFNVLNMPGNPNSIAADGVLSTQASGQTPRQLQFSARLIW
jgi:hypothetical protein